MLAPVLFDVLMCGGNECFSDGVGCCLCVFVHVCSLVAVCANDEVCVWGLGEEVYLDASVLYLNGEVVEFGGDGAVLHEYDGVFGGIEGISRSLGLLHGC